MEVQSKRWGSKVFWIIFGLAAVLFGAQMVSAYIYPNTTTLYVGDGAFTARVASNEDTRKKGLSNTASLPGDEAMLFSFDMNSKWGIWMKDMHYPLDIVWLDESKKVVDMALNVSPESYPKVFTPKKDARYVIEFTAGTVKKERIREGQPAIFSDTRRRP